MHSSILPPVPGPRIDSNEAVARFCYTRSGAVYVVLDRLVMRFKGYDTRAHRLISRVPVPLVGRHLRASVLTEQGQTGSICSTRLVRVAEGPTRVGAGLDFSRMTPQEIRMYEAARALAEVGRAGTAIPGGRG